jgi:pyruvate dehydrogenase E1 component alpha subunit
LNLASIWKLPVIFVCENNRWAVLVPASYSLSVEDVAVRAVGYNIPGVTVDGTDVLAVHETMQEAVRRARAGEGPTLIECKTYQWRIHAERPEDPPDLRPQEEIDMGRQHDPITFLASRLVEQGVATTAALEQIDREVESAVEEAVAFAEASPFPKPEDALLDVFAP